MKAFDEQFQTIPDNRTGNAVKYQLPDILKAAFAMFSLNPPSLLDFNTQTTAEEKNLRNSYRIEALTAREEGGLLPAVHMLRYDDAAPTASPSRFSTDLIGSTSPRPFRAGQESHRCLRRRAARASYEQEPGSR